MGDRQILVGCGRMKFLLQIDSKFLSGHLILPFDYLRTSVGTSISIFDNIYQVN